MGVMNTMKLYEWYVGYEFVTLDNPRVSGDDWDILALESTLQSYFDEGTLIPPDKWEGVVAWVQRFHPRVPLRLEDIPQAFTDDHEVHFYSPQVRALLEKYTNGIQYLPTPLLDAGSGQSLAIYYAANHLIQYKCVKSIVVTEYGAEFQVDRPIKPYPVFVLLNERGLKKVIVERQVRNALLRAEVAEEWQFTPIRLTMVVG